VSVEDRRRHLAWTAQTVAEALRQRRFPYASPGAIRRAQTRRVQSAVAYAAAHVPYYRETMRRLVLEPGDFRSAEDLSRLPLIERADLQRDPEYFVSERWPPDTCIKLESGGTTGEPVAYFRDPHTVLVIGAHYERARAIIRRIAGAGLAFREAIIHPPDSSGATNNDAFLSRSQLPSWLRVRDRTFSMLKPIEDLVPELCEFQPHVIRSYGSHLDALFTYLGRHRIAPRELRVATFGSDPISDGVREWVQSTLDVEVLGEYGAIEAPHIGFECERHRGYHANLDLYPIRLIDANGGEVKRGDAGELVVSNLVNRGTMLLNYRIGDRLAPVAEPCPCGRRLPLVSYLSRTKSAWLDLGRGERVHVQALRAPLRHEQELWRYQIVQEAPQVLALRLVSRPAADRAAIGSRLRERLSASLPDGVMLQIDFVDDLPRSPSGKIQPVVPLEQRG
jgi:phenylacetate-CoA ligase